MCKCGPPAMLAHNLADLMCSVSKSSILHSTVQSIRQRVPSSCACTCDERHHSRLISIAGTMRNARFCQSGPLHRFTTARCCFRRLPVIRITRVSDFIVFPVLAIAKNLPGENHIDGLSNLVSDSLYSHFVARTLPGCLCATTTAAMVLPTKTLDAIQSL